MAYSLDQFCSDSRTILKSGGSVGGGKTLEVKLAEIAALLRQLLANPAFVSATFKSDDTFSKKPLFHDVETDFRVLAHVHQGPKEGPPHSHGTSWAIYGTALGVTGMKEWRRANPPDEPHAVLEMSDRYDLGVGQARGYGPHMIHSTIHPGKAWVIRVTGTDLDVLPRYRFNKTADRIAGQA